MGHAAPLFPSIVPIMVAAKGLYTLFCPSVEALEWLVDAHCGVVVLFYAMINVCGKLV